MFYCNLHRKMFTGCLLSLFYCCLLVQSAFSDPEVLRWLMHLFYEMGASLPGSALCVRLYITLWSNCHNRYQIQCCNKPHVIIIIITVFVEHSLQTTQPKHQKQNCTTDSCRLMLLAAHGSQTEKPNMQTTVRILPDKHLHLIFVLVFQSLFSTEWTYTVNNPQRVCYSCQNHTRLCRVMNVQSLLVKDV